jgi:opacity protein-like surface antigen
MKYIKTLVSALAALALLATTAIAATNAPAVPTAPAAADAWTLTLAGAGSTTTSGDSHSSIGAELGIGHTGKVLLPVEFGLRQKFSYDSAGNNSFNYGTKVYNDFTLLKIWQLELQAGGNVGATYGETSLRFSVAPEAVAKLYLKKDVWAFGRVELPYNVTDGRLENRLDYTLGVGLSF